MNLQRPRTQLSKKGQFLISDSRLAIFALVRGYHGFSKFRYLMLVLRNLSLRFFAIPALKKQFVKIDMILFHEGNISLRDQKIIQILALHSIHFVDVGEVFKPDSNHVWTHDKSRSLGYSLMCKFNYYNLWSYLDNYDYGLRVDEDCFVISIPSISPDETLITGYISREDHAITNETLPAVLESLDMESYYDHRFPYTNAYLTNIKFWRQSQVSDFLQKIAENPLALEHRWGDLPILGIALKAFANWNWKEAEKSDFRYFHTSHFSYVADGKIIEFSLLSKTMNSKIVTKFAKFFKR